MNYDQAVSQMLNVDGALAAAVVDFSSGMLLAGGGSAAIDLEIAAAGNTEVMRAKMKTMEMLKLNDEIEDILIASFSKPSRFIPIFCIRPCQIKLGIGSPLFGGYRKSTVI